MNAMNTSLKCSALLLVGLAGLAGQTHAGDFGEMEIEPRFRAKVAKEKIKMKAAEQRLGAFNPNNASHAECGSQNIGTIDTGGRIGRMPREVFVFAPNAINVVNARGCD
jgi:hypothetical protein